MTKKRMHHENVKQYICIPSSIGRMDCPEGESPRLHTVHRKDPGGAHEAICIVLLHYFGSE
jgi:hypothetical protein